jgi:RHS repeat-associated protein
MKLIHVASLSARLMPPDYLAERTGAATGQVNYAVFRQHGARIGRFHMADSIRSRVSNPQRLNRYACVLGNPTNRSDPRGCAFQERSYRAIQP